MNVLGIVAEYNPFHNGHLYHLNRSVEICKADYTVCVMSGNFVQRGEPALFNKWIRAEAAVKNGIDLVIELPFAFASSSAEHFSQGAVSILNKLGCVTHISFGSETGRIEPLYSAAKILSHESLLFKEHLKNNLSKGISFPNAREISLNKIAKDSSSTNVLNQPNNILGVEYLKWLIRLNSTIEPITIPRHIADYNDDSIIHSICSATAIRKLMEDTKEPEPLKNITPSLTYETILEHMNNGVTPLFICDVFHYIKYKLLMSDPTEIRDIFSVSEGIENRICNLTYRQNTMEDLISHIKTKRYTRTSIQRILIHILMGLSKMDMHTFQVDENCLYARILGFSLKGSQLIRLIKESDTTTLPLLTNINKEATENSSFYPLLKYDILSSDVYHLASGKYDMYQESDYVKKPFIL